MTLLAPGTYTTPGGDTLIVPAPTTAPPAASGPSPYLPAPIPGLTLPTGVALYDPFTSLNPAIWSPTWFGNVKPQNSTTMDADNVQIGRDPVSGLTGLLLRLTADKTGAIISSNPDDGQHPSGGGFQIAPAPGKPVYVEYKVWVPGNSAGKVANWPADWMDGQDWPEDGESDVEEGLSGYNAWHVHYGTGSGQSDGANVNSTPGEHYFAMLWSTTGHTAIYDGKVVGSDQIAVTSPEYLLSEYSLGAGDLLPATKVVEHILVTQ